MGNNWPKVSLGELLHLERRPVKVRAEERYQEIGIYCFGRGIFHKPPRTGFEVGGKDLFLLKEGDFILQVTFAWEGAIAIVSAAEEGMYGSTRYPTFRVHEERCVPQFLLNYFRTEAGLQQLINICPGSAGRNRVLSIKRIPEIKVPLPPVAEQQRIVARINRLDAKIDATRKERELAAQESKALLQAHLNKLFGDPYNDVRGDLAIDNWEKLTSVVDDVADGPHITPAYVPEGVPFITVLNITSGRIRFGDNKFVTEQDHRLFQQRAKAERGDVLISKDGTIGIPCFVDTEREFSFFVSVALIKPKRTILDGEFLAWALRAPYLQEQIAKRSRGDMIRHLVLREIRDLTVPVPFLSEQRRIVAHLDNLQKKIDYLTAMQAETSKELEALVPSILDEAFRGA